MFNKSTVISGRKNGELKCLIMSGHWNIDSAINRGRKSGLTGQMSIEHSVSDTSGGGRGGHDGKYTVSDNDVCCRQSNWSEFGQEH